MQMSHEDIKATFLKIKSMPTVCNLISLIFKNGFLYLNY